MATQPAPGPVFTEAQWFFRRWWWLMLGAAIALIAPLVATTHQPHGGQTLLTAAPLVLLVLAGLCSLRLMVRVDAFGVHYQYIPLLNRWRHWPWSEFTQVFPRTYSPLGDHGGWGIRGLPGNLAYNVWGKAGLQLIFRSGNRLLLGTQQPEELRRVLA
ncbi:MAG: hypothetical protein EOO63_07095, partial [Hymenobacter sp.]